MSVISQLKHPNIVEWLEQGMTRGQFWFAMEYVAGTNLEALAKEQPGPLPDRARPAGWPARSSRGWSRPTGLGFVHRDIKPENILIGHGIGGTGRQDLRLRPGQELPRAWACRA